MKRKALLLAIVVAVSACGEVPEAVTETTAPLYVDITTGHGPFACTGDLPGFGYFDVFSAGKYSGMCERYRGDFSGPGYGGHVFSFRSPHWPVVSLRVSPQYTTASLCRGGVYSVINMCQGSPVNVTGQISPVPFTPNPQNIVVSYLPPCPQTPGMTTVHQCTGVYTPEDGSGYATVVVGDGFVSPGLPYGHPLNLGNANTGSGVNDCAVDLQSMGLYSQFLPPPDYPYGAEVVAVYDCP